MVLARPPIRFGSCSRTEQECHYNAFVGEAGCGRWAISQKRKFLWGSEFKGVKVKKVRGVSKGNDGKGGTEQNPQAARAHPPRTNLRV